MKFSTTKLPGVLLIEPKAFEDSRGYFMETYQKELFAKNGIPQEFVQDNHSYSAKGVLRGLHFQNPPFEQAKLVRVVDGEVFDVVVDIRPGSKTFGQWEGHVLSAENRKMLYIPKGFAHGFQTLCDDTELFYLMGNYYDPGSAHGIRWNDPLLAIDWPIALPVMSEKDQMLPLFQELK